MDLLHHLEILSFLLLLGQWSSFVKRGSSGVLADTAQIEALEICLYLGGHCAGTCRREMRHRWGIPLCQGGNRCCAEQSRKALSVSTSPASVAESTTTTAETCTANSGKCQAWYQSCNGTSTNHSCGSLWSTCCIQSEGSIEESHLHPSPTVLAATTVSRSSQLYTTSLLNLGSVTPGQCGVPHRSRRKKRIVGGSVAHPAAWPWHVVIKTAFGSADCGGTVISNRWILTAAHCFKLLSSASFYQVVTGTEQSPDFHQNHRIDRIVKHPLYRDTDCDPGEDACEGQAHDIALLKLDLPLNFSNRLQPVCMPSAESDSQARHCWLAGYGMTSPNNIETELTFRHVSGTVLTDQECQRLWGNKVDEKMLCFGNATKGACKGDSGGGMYCEEDGRFTINGVISWGSAGCDRKSTVLTDVAHFASWIQDIIRSN